MRAEAADIVLMPYNYVSDARIRSRLDINLKQDILIIDEAHNIPQVIEDSSSFKLDTETFIRILAEIKLIKSRVHGTEKESKTDR